MLSVNRIENWNYKIRNSWGEDDRNRKLLILKKKRRNTCEIWILKRYVFIYSPWINLSQSQFESEKTSLSEALSKAQISLQREKTKTAELTTQNRTLKASFDNLKHETDDYKIKAQRILQTKGINGVEKVVFIGYTHQWILYRRNRSVWWRCLV